MRLTREVIEGAYQCINPATRDRELDLRGYRITVIENLGATLDQFDSIDFSDNAIRKLDGFPLLTRLKKLLLNNNRVIRISEHLEESLPNLSWLILTNNELENLGDLDPLATLPKLECLSLLDNPVTTKKYYRLYVIHKIPHLRILDFRRIKLKERQEASKLFKGKKGKELEKQIGVRSKTFTPGQGPDGDVARPKPAGPRPEDVEAIKQAIAKAQSLEEIERLNQMLKSGYIPGRDEKQKEQKSNQPEEEEEDHEMDVSTSVNGN